MNYSEKDEKPLSQYPTSIKWLSQFSITDRTAASLMLDELVLISEDKVSIAIREGLHRFSASRAGKKRRIALFAEREYAESTAFDSKLTPDKAGNLRMRAYGRNGRPAVKPKRGSPRVGSEGLIAFIISQSCETWKDLFINHPGPDRIRAKTRPPNTIALVTDFIGSGKRIRDMLDKFYRVPSVKSWISGNHINFVVVAAAATHSGASAVRQHRLKPDVIYTHAVPTIAGHRNFNRASQWYDLIARYGPATGRGSGRSGFGAAPALVAFSYRIPNNTPAIIHNSDSNWNALYIGAAPSDLNPVFGMRSLESIITEAAENNGVNIDKILSAQDASEVLILSLLRGRWRRGTEVTLSERTGISIPDVIDILKTALNRGLIDEKGRLTDAGQALLGAARRERRERPLVKTNSTLYIPGALRTPRGIV